MPTGQKKKRGRQNYDWGKIKQDYVTSPQMTLRKIAEKYGITEKTVFKKSRADGWFETRKKVQADITAKGIAKTADRLARELSEEADFLTLMKGHVNKMLRDEQQFNRHLIVESSMDETGSYTTTKEEIFDKVDARALKDTMQVLRMMEEMTRSIYNLQKAETIQKHQIEKARLELERERFEFEKQKAELLKPDGTNVIRIDGIEKGWAE